MYKVRIISNTAGYEVQTKKHWWSRWTTEIFVGMSGVAIEIANGIINGEKVSDIMKKKSISSQQSNITITKS